MTRLGLIAALVGLLACAQPHGAAAQEAQWALRMADATAALKRRDYADAEAELTKALAIAESFGDRDPRLARTLHNLGYIFRAQGRLANAEPMYLRALGLQEAILGREHLEVAQTLNNLAAVYRESGALDRAEPLYRRSLQIREKRLGATHPEVADSLNNLAGVLRLLGHNVEAEALAERAIAIMETAEGGDPAKVATWLYNLSRLYLEQGRFAEAAKFETRAREIWRAQGTTGR